MSSSSRYNGRRNSDSGKGKFKIQLDHEKTLYSQLQSPSCTGAFKGRKIITEIASEHSIHPTQLRQVYIR